MKPATIHGGKVPIPAVISWKMRGLKPFEVFNLFHQEEVYFIILEKGRGTWQKKWKFDTLAIHEDNKESTTCCSSTHLSTTSLSVPNPERSPPLFSGRRRQYLYGSLLQIYWKTTFLVEAVWGLGLLPDRRPSAWPFTLARLGNNIVASGSLYGGTLIYLPILCPNGVSR